MKIRKPIRQPKHRKPPRRSLLAGAKLIASWPARLGRLGRPRPEALIPGFRGGGPFGGGNLLV